MTPTLSDDSAFLLAARGAIGESRWRRCDLLCAFPYHSHPTIRRLNRMQFSVAIAQIESPQARGFAGFPRQNSPVLLASHLHALALMMRMQPHPAFSGSPVPSDSGSESAKVAIELSDEEAAMLDDLRQPVYGADDGAALRDIVFTWWEQTFLGAAEAGAPAIGDRKA